MTVRGERAGLAGRFFMFWAAPRLQCFKKQRQMTGRLTPAARLA